MIKGNLKNGEKAGEREAGVSVQKNFADTKAQTGAKGKVLKYERDFSDTDIRFRVEITDWTEWHTHNYWEIVFVLDNSIVNCLNSDSIVMPACSLCLVKPDDRHRILRHGTESVHFFNFEVNCEFVKIFFDLLDAGLHDRFLERGNIIVSTNESFMNGLCHDTTKAQLKQATPGEYQAILRRIVAKLLLVCLQTSDAEDDAHPIVKTVLALMKDSSHIAGGLSGICREAGYTEQYVMQIFRREKLDSPNMVFRRIKLEYACGLLATTTKSIIEIMEMTGFSSLSHFNSIFKVRMGMSPAAYRKSQRKYIGY